MGIFINIMSIVYKYGLILKPAAEISLLRESEKFKYNSHFKQWL